MLPKCVAVLGLARGDVLPGIKTTHARGGTAGQAGAHSTRLPCTSRRRTSSRRPSGPRRRGTLRSRREYSPPAATHWIDRLARAHHTGQLETELKKIHRYKLIIIDEVGYIFRHRRREPVLRARHFPLRDRLDPVTSNLPFGRWAEVFGDEIVAATMIDRLVHHAEVLTCGCPTSRA